ncbi:hypothetical protein [Asanoa ferruginea]|uniref:hypothetical protein n=1 Tax=Asanoa ferruginea TaxID=53367 RepID=UPI000E266FDC|nr:hypothetical protein [Asanoa ferruginea]
MKISSRSSGTAVSASCRPRTDSLIKRSSSSVTQGWAWLWNRYLSSRIFFRLGAGVGAGVGATMVAPRSASQDAW